MKTDIKEIAERLRGMRDILGLSLEDCARTCDIPVDTYALYESGNNDIPVTFLIHFASLFHIELTTLLTGDAPKMHSYALTRKGQGSWVDRRKEYKYQALNEAFIHKKAEPFIVTVLPEASDAPVPLNQHQGQEFNFILNGRLKLLIHSKELILEEGDSIWFDSALPHGMKALDDKEVKFLAIVF